MKWDAEYDLVAIGAGAAGLTAALTAADAGASALVLEASDLVGGTTTFSGAILWVPFNKWSRAAGIEDSREKAEAYVERALGQRGRTELWSAFFDNVNDVIEFISSRTGLTFHLTRYPDAFAEWEEGSSARHINPNPYGQGRLGSWRARIRKSPAPPIVMVEEINANQILIKGPPAILKLAPRLAYRALARKVTLGPALISALLHGCLKRGVKIEVKRRVTELVVENDAVVGVRFKRNGKTVSVKARGGVVLACGGFDWNEALCDRFQPGPFEQRMSPPVNNGDNILLAESVGAQLAHMNEAWNLPGGQTPGMSYEGKPICNFLFGDRVWPHSILVNREGRRFTNESAQNAGEFFAERDSETGAHKHLPAWVIFDRSYRARYPTINFLRPRTKDPEWLIKENTLAALATRLDMESAVLTATIERFNAMARDGRDTDFGRGDGKYERYFGDPEAPHPCLGSVETAPFYAIRALASAVGTKGGAKTDGAGRVLRTNGDIIPGFYAAGNAAANFNGPLTVAAGCTLTPAMTIAHLAAKSALARRV